MDEHVLQVAISEALNLRLAIEAGGNPSALKLNFCEKLREQDGGGAIVDLMLAFESTFRTGVLEKTVNNFYGGNFANINLGNQFGAVNAAINGIPLEHPNSAGMLDALRKLTEGIKESSELNDGQKQEALESIETIADQATLPLEKRKVGVFKAAMGHLPTILSSSAAAIKIWEFAHPAIVAFFAK